MPEEVFTANTTELSEVKDAELDTTEEEVTNEATFEDGEQSKEEPKADKPKQSAEEDAKFAMKRREAERKAEIERAKVEAVITALGNNPYTGEEMKDASDVEEYLTMKEIERNGGDPKEDYSKFVKEQKRQEKTETEQKQQKEEWLEKDRDDFFAKHPDVKFDELLADKHFRKYADGKVGTEPMSDIYEGYAELLAEFEEKAKTKATRLFANKVATPGALKSDTTAEGVLYTREELAKLTSQQMDKNWAKVEKSYAALQKN